MTVAERLGKSQREFRDVVWPEIASACGGGEIVPVETVSESGFARQLDRLAGIDSWQVQGNKQMRGIASRVQHANYASFTIRSRLVSGAETELDKRLRAIRDPERGWLLPAITVQAYLGEKDEFIAAAIAHTRPLYLFVADGQAGREFTIQQNRYDGNEYYCVWWSTLRRRNVGIRVVGDEDRLVDGAPDRCGMPQTLFSDAA